MFFMSIFFTSAPKKFSTPLQKKTYRVLIDLHIPFEREETNEAITVADCVQVDATWMKRIGHMDDSVYSLAGGIDFRRGRVGMRTKLHAVALATAQGIDTVILNRKSPYTLYDIVGDMNTGTLFEGKWEK